MRFITPLTHSSPLTSSFWMQSMHNEESRSLLAFCSHLDSSLCSEWHFCSSVNLSVTTRLLRDFQQNTASCYFIYNKRPPKKISLVLNREYFTFNPYISHRILTLLDTHFFVRYFSRIVYIKLVNWNFTVYFFPTIITWLLAPNKDFCLHML